MPLVSVIIPNYNHSNFLDRRIQSVLNQSFCDFELILLDDCSSDSSVEIIDKYRKNPKVSQVIINKQNSGSPFAQWKKGIILAQGEYVWIAESDDWACTDFLSETVAVLKANPFVGFVYTDSYVYRDNHIEERFSDINNRFKQTAKWSSDYIISGKEELKILSDFCSVNDASAVLFRKDALQSINWNFNFRYMGDWYIYIQLAEKYDVAYISTPYNNYNYHDSNTTNLATRGLGAVYERFTITHHLLLSGLPDSKAKNKIKNNLLDYASLWRQHFGVQDILVFIRKACNLDAKLAVWYVFEMIKIRMKWIARKIAK